MSDEGNQDGFDREKVEIFEALGHPTRIKIVQVLSKSPLGFAELKREAGIENSGLLQFHLGKLEGLVKAEGGSYALTEKGRTAFGVIVTKVGKVMASPSPQKRCASCGSMMDSHGKQSIRMGDVNAVNWIISALYVPDIGAGVQFETFICSKCGKVDLFADEATRKYLKGEFYGDYFYKCSKCGKQYVKDYEKCPFCGTESPRMPKT